MPLLPPIVGIEEPPLSLSLPEIDTSILRKITEQFLSSLAYKPPHNALLTPEQVRFIRHGDGTVAAKADALGVSRSVVQNVLAGRTYTSVY